MVSQRLAKDSGAHLKAKKNLAINANIKLSISIASLLVNTMSSLDSIQSTYQSMASVHQMTQMPVFVQDWLSKGVRFTKKATQMASKLLKIRLKT